MTRLSASLLFLGFLSTGLAIAQQPDFDQINRNAKCDNDCFFGSFPGGSCTNDAACMCTQQKYRETYFCCLGKCDASVLPDSIARQTTQCVAFNIPFTFDAEAVCGIKLVTTSSAITSGATTSTATSASQSSAVSASITVTTTSAASQTSSGGPTPTATTNSAPSKMKLSNGVAVLIAMAGMLT